MDFLTKISRGISDSVRTMFGALKRVDYEVLSHYILNIHQVHDLDSIVDESAKCLKDILDYRLFAFVLQSDDGIHVWTDPTIQEKKLKRLIHNDFDTDAPLHMHTLNRPGKWYTLPNTDRDSIITSKIVGDHYHATLYVTPERNMFGYHADILTILTRTLDTAISNYMRVKYLKNEAAFDPLTDCYNRREFDRLIEHNIANSRRYDHELSVIFIDIDHFKGVNDTYGHQAGDIVLKEVSGAIISSIRKSDYMARYGGEEFVVILPYTKMTRAIELAERLRALVENLEIRVSPRLTVKVTASFGVASLKDNSDKQSLLKAADHMLYMAKEHGRNQVMPQLKLHVFAGGRFAEAIRQEDLHSTL